MSNMAIKVSGVSKSFKVPHERYSSLKQNAVHFFTKKSFSKFEAVKEASFEVKTGEFFGIVGRNGCGKSTLLKLLAGIYTPTTGEIEINGSLSPFIELGVGFNPELTARDNVYLNGAILGLTRREVEAKFDDIMGFAELEDFIDQKLKNFSSGMQVRLAFSIAIQAQSDILLIDEVLAVGDASFQKKCFDVFKRLKREGKTIVFVTHDMSNVEKFCDRVLVMDSGKQLTIVGPEQASDIYGRLNAENDLAMAETFTVKERWGNGKVKIKGVKFLDATEKPQQIFKTGQPFNIEIELEEATEEVPLTLGLAVYSSDGFHIVGPNTGEDRLTSKNTLFSYHLDKLPLAEGTYLLTVAAVSPKGVVYDHLDKAFSFAVSGATKEFGNFVWFGQWRKS